MTTRSHFTSTVQDALNVYTQKNLITKIEKVGGAGYKVLRCLEGATVYIAGAGCKKWDTAAPEAILTAAGNFA